MNNWLVSEEMGRMTKVPFFLKRTGGVGQKGKLETMLKHGGGERVSRNKQFSFLWGRGIGDKKM